MKCLNCKHWDMAGGNWGYCKLINLESEHLGANLQGFIDGLGELDSKVKVFLETDSNFYCKLYEGVDIV